MISPSEFSFPTRELQCATKKARRGISAVRAGRRDEELVASRPGGNLRISCRGLRLKLPLHPDLRPANALRRLHVHCPIRVVRPVLDETPLRPGGPGFLDAIAGIRRSVFPPLHDGPKV